MTTKAPHPAHPGRRPRAFETVSPFLLDEVGWTREQILRMRAKVRPVVFAARRQSVDSPV